MNIKKIIGFVAFCIITYLFGIGIFCDNKPLHEFYLFGPHGALPYMCAFGAFITFLFGIWYLFNGPVLQDTGRTYSLRPFFWGIVAVFFAFVIVCSISKDIGYGFSSCSNEYCYSKNGQRIEYEKMKANDFNYYFGRPTELRASRSQIGGFIVCPICGETNLVTENWWN